MPLLLILLFIGLLVAFARRTKKRGAPKKAEQQKQADELITVILPIISKDK